TGSRVLRAGGVEIERSIPGRRVVVGIVAHERLITDGRVVVAGFVVKERRSTDGRVVATGGVGLERTSTVGHVFAAGCVASERTITGDRVGVGIAETGTGLGLRYWRKH